MSEAGEHSAGPFPPEASEFNEALEARCNILDTASVRRAEGLDLDLHTRMRRAWSAHVVADGGDDYDCPFPHEKILLVPDATEEPIADVRRLYVSFPFDTDFRARGPLSGITDQQMLEEFPELLADSHWERPIDQLDPHYLAYYKMIFLRAETEHYTFRFIITPKSDQMLLPGQAMHVDARHFEAAGLPLEFEGLIDVSNPSEERNQIGIPALRDIQAILRNGPDSPYVLDSLRGEPQRNNLPPTAA